MLDESILEWRKALESTQDISSLFSESRDDASELSSIGEESDHDLSVDDLDLSEEEAPGPSRFADDSSDSEGEGVDWRDLQTRCLRDWQRFVADGRYQSLEIQIGGLKDGLMPTHLFYSFVARWMGSALLNRRDVTAHYRDLSVMHHISSASSTVSSVFDAARAKSLVLSALVQGAHLEGVGPAVNRWIAENIALYLDSAAGAARLAPLLDRLLQPRVALRVYRRPDELGRLPEAQVLLAAVCAHLNDEPAGATSPFYDGLVDLVTEGELKEADSLTLPTATGRGGLLADRDTSNRGFWRGQAIRALNALAVRAEEDEEAEGAGWDKVLNMLSTLDEDEDEDELSSFDLALLNDLEQLAAEVAEAEEGGDDEVAEVLRDILEASFASAILDRYPELLPAYVTYVAEQEDPDESELETPLFQLRCVEGLQVRPDGSRSSIGGKLVNHVLMTPLRVQALVISQLRQGRWQAACAAGLRPYLRHDALRPILPRGVTLDCRAGGYALLANLRLSRRSQVRNFLNTRAMRSAAGDSMVLRWCARGGVAYEKVGLNPSEGLSREDYLPITGSRAGSYGELWQMLLLHQNRCWHRPMHNDVVKRQYHVSDNTVARIICQILIGREPKPLGASAEHWPACKQFLVEMTTLLFGTEASRNPASLITNRTLLERILRGGISWYAMLCDGRRYGGGMMPMSMSSKEGGEPVKCQRYLDHCFYGPYMPLGFHYDGTTMGGAPADLLKVAELTFREGAALTIWARDHEIGLRGDPAGFSAETPGMAVFFARLSRTAGTWYPVAPYAGSFRTAVLGEIESFRPDSLLDPTI